MRELEMKEKKIKEIQNTGDRLLREDHPARPTVEVGGAGAGPQGASGSFGGGGAVGPMAWGRGLRTLLSAVLPGCLADAVELDAAALLLHRSALEGEHSLLPGEDQSLSCSCGPAALPWKGSHGT